MNAPARTAAALVAPGKGILAADESTKTITARLQARGIASTEWTRRDWREVLISARGAERWISGVILYDETIRQLTGDGRPFCEALQACGLIPGIKVDAGLRPLASSEREKLTDGLDGLEQRLVQYAALGARFCKWRSVFAIGDGLPSIECLKANAQRLASYARLCQHNGLVAILEPEVLMDGPYTLADCAEATQRTLGYVFDALGQGDFDLTGALLKTNMVLAGTDCPDRPGVDEIAAATIRCLRAVVPNELAGVVFLSGGQGSEQATANLRAINAPGAQPWPLSFSFGRALQQDALAIWTGSDERRDAAQAAFLERARANGEAARPSAGQARGDLAA